MSTVNPAGETDLLPLAALAKLLPIVRGSKPPNRSTLYRWATVGLKSRSGERIRLETQFVGGTLCATLDDVRRFCDSLDDVEWQPPAVYRNRREEERMRREADAAFALAMAI
jgi:hypothetical protein